MVSLPIVLTVVELLALACVVAGLALVSVPLALVCGGGLVVVACEVAERRRLAAAAAPDLRAVPGRGERL